MSYLTIGARVSAMSKTTLMRLQRSLESSPNFFNDTKHVTSNIERITSSHRIPSQTAWASTYMELDPDVELRQRWRGRRNSWACEKLLDVERRKPRERGGRKEDGAGTQTHAEPSTGM
jgi:hypothetical protein